MVGEVDLVGFGCVGDGDGDVFGFLKRDGGVL